MKEENIIRERSFQFAIRIVNAYKHLTNERREFVMSKQMLKSGTSIGANIEEAIGGQSKGDFVAKLSISYKEIRETIYWIRLLTETDYFTQEEAESLMIDAEEICKILTSILKTLKSTK